MAASMSLEQGLMSAGAISKVVLDSASFAADADVSGTVEITLPRGKEISSVLLELCSWRHLSLKKADKTHVEQLTRQTLELFPNIEVGGAGRNGHDTKTLKDSAIFTFRFGALQPTKAPTIEAFSTGRIKHYMTCFVHKRSGLLNREKVLERNQFQVPVTAPIIEVDALFPDRTFTSLEARPNAGNPEDFEFRVRCNTHLLTGLPFLVEVDMANHAVARCITLSLHQRAFASIGRLEEEQTYRSLYIHEVPRPQPAREGHFRGKELPRPLAFGKKIYQVEWTCPRRDARTRLPFRETLYARTAEANLECGLTLRVEVDLESGDRLVSVVHGITYAPDWIDARPQTKHQGGPSLRQERSVLSTSESPASSLNVASRRLSSASSQSDLRVSPGFAPPNFTTFRRPQQGSVLNTSAGVHLRQGSHASTLTTGDSYLERQRAQFASQRGSPRIPSEAEPTLTHGSYGLSRNTSGVAPRASAGFSSGQGNVYGDALLGSVETSEQAMQQQRPERIMLPPASVRASMSSAFENLNTGANESPVSAGSSVHTGRVQSPVSRPPTVYGPRSPGSGGYEPVSFLPPGTPPPPSQPLPPAPPTSAGSNAGRSGLGLIMGGLQSRNASTSQHSLISPIEGNDRPTSRMGMRSHTAGSGRSSRPAIALGISQTTVQTAATTTQQTAGLPQGAAVHGQQRSVSRDSPLVPPTPALHAAAGAATMSPGPEYFSGGSSRGSPAMHGAAFDVATRVTSPVQDDARSVRSTATALSPQQTAASMTTTHQQVVAMPSAPLQAGTAAGLVQGLLMLQRPKRVSEPLQSPNESGGSGHGTVQQAQQQPSSRDSGYAGSTSAGMRTSSAGGWPQRVIQQQTSPRQQLAKEQQQQQQQYQQQEDKAQEEQDGANEILLG